MFEIPVYGPTASSLWSILELLSKNYILNLTPRTTCINLIWKLVRKVKDFYTGWSQRDEFQRSEQNYGYKSQTRTQSFWTKNYRLTIVHMLLCYTVALMKLNDVILHAWNLIFWMDEQYKRNVYLLFCLIKKGFSFIYNYVCRLKKGKKGNKKDLQPDILGIFSGDK